MINDFVINLVRSTSDNYNNSLKQVILMKMLMNCSTPVSPDNIPLLVKCILLLESNIKLPQIYHSLLIIFN